MQIIVFLNTRFEEFLAQENTAQMHALLKTLKRKLDKGLKVTDSHSSWQSITGSLGIDSGFSPAKYCRQKLDLDVPYALMATPVRVQLGIRHSQTHFLPIEQLPTKSQIDQLNEYFQDYYFIYPVSPDQYLLCSEKPMDLNLDRNHWSPDLADFTLQMLTSDSRLRKFQTDVQSWCHREALAWNGLYLWGQGLSSELAEVTVKSDAGLRNPYAFMHSHMEAAKKIFLVDSQKTLANGMDNELLSECEFLLNASRDTQINLVFSDHKQVSLTSESYKDTDLWAWLKGIFRCKE